MVFSSRMFGIKGGILIALTSLLYLSQTTININIPRISDYINITIPTTIYGYNLVIIAWALLVIGLIMFFMGVFDIKPFDF